MSEPENKKPTLSKLAVFAFLQAILGVCIIGFLILFRNNRFATFDIKEVQLLLLCLSICAGVASGVVANNLVKNRKDDRWGRWLSISGILVSSIIIVYILLPLPPYPRRIYLKDICPHKLKQLYIAIYLYADEHKNVYPDPNRWCDLVYPYIQDYNLFICPFAPQNSKKLKCTFAINPYCEPNSPKDMVLLFEAKGGWNKYGGSELLTFDNHKKEGAAVGFNDGNVKFIKKEDINKLKWK